ncbi:MAG: fimbrillin family protein [Muribaculaceae bacterium]|nr:fimbrillin family protein [Muribaculaceae bacterium]
MRLNIFNSLMGLCVATAAVSCSNEVVDENCLPVGSESDMISFVVADDNTRGGSFGNRPGSSTRGSVTTSESMKKNPFAVYGDMTNLDSSNPITLFFKEPVSYNNSKWTYANTRYWFPNYEYSFLAIHPSTAIPSEGSTNGEITNFDYKGDASVSFDYTSPSDYSQATDILIAGHRRKYTASTDDKTVVLSFGHIMSRLNFVANLENSNIEVTGITIEGIVSKAKYSVRPEIISSGNTETSDLTGTLWSEHSGSTNISKNKNFLPTTDSQGKLFISLFPDNDPLIVIPQKVTEKLKVVVTYNIGGQKDETIEGYLDSALLGSWMAGKLYTYTFTLKATNNEFIIFSQPDIEEWKEADGSSYIIIN